MSTSSSEAFYASCDTARAKFAKYCSEPVPRDPYKRLRWVMGGAHLMFVEQLYNVYKRAESIPPREEQEFTHFSYIAIALIEQHHHLEETIIFPSLEPEFKTPVLDEHAAFAKGLHDLSGYLRSVMGVKAGKLYGEVVPDPSVARVPYDGAKLKGHIEGFSTPLFTHLSHEIDWLAPENIRASGVTVETLNEIERREVHHIQTELDPSTSLVHALFHCPPYSGFPDMPWFLLKIMIPWVFWWKHRNLWKYCPRWSADGAPIINIKA